MEVDAEMQEDSSSSSLLPDCPVCLDTLGTSGGPVTLPCGHNGCSGCLMTAKEMTGQCPVCRAPCADVSLSVNLGLENLLATIKALEQGGASGSGALAAASKQAEQDLQTRRDRRNKMHTHMLVIFCTLKDMQNYMDAGGRAGLLEPSQVEGLCLPHSMRCTDLKPLACSRSGLPQQYTYLRLWYRRQNGTSRPDTIICGADELTLGAFATKEMQDWCPTAGFFRKIMFLEEVEQAAWPFVSCHLGILLFIKLLDLTQQTIKMVGHLQVPGQAQIGSLKPLISDKAGLTMDGMTLDLLEEVKPDMCDFLSDHRTVAESQLENGDILIALCRRDGHPLPQDLTMRVQRVQAFLQGF